MSKSLANWFMNTFSSLVAEDDPATIPLDGSQGSEINVSYVNERFHK